MEIGIPHFPADLVSPSMVFRWGGEVCIAGSLMAKHFLGIEDHCETEPAD